MRRLKPVRTIIWLLVLVLVLLLLVMMATAPDAAGQSWIPRVPWFW
jgi:hypothetical protein